MVFLSPASLCPCRKNKSLGYCGYFRSKRFEIKYRYYGRKLSYKSNSWRISMSLLSKEDITSGDQTTDSSVEHKQPNSVKRSEKVKDDSFLRKSLMVLASIGVIDTVYLTLGKLFLTPEVMCHTEGCIQVLQSPFAAIFGIPISFFGFLAYSAVFLLSACPLLCAESSNVKDKLDKLSKKALSILTLAMSVVSMFLMYVLFFQIQSFCPYCVLSAFLSGSLFITSSFLHFANVGWKKWIRHSFVVIMLLMSITGGALVAFGTASLSFSNQVFDPPSITSHSDARMMKLAEKLKSKNARMYGAFWCEHCYRQKQMLGQEAFDKIEYIECSKNGRGSQYKLCREKDVPGYPTWEIDGELYPGEQSIEELEELADIRK